MQKTTRAMLAASVAGLLTAVGAGMVSAEDAKATDKPTPCYGINKCKGAGECGGKGHGCGGQNACKGQGRIQLPEQTCLKIEGGRLTEEKPS